MKNRRAMIAGLAVLAIVALIGNRVFESFQPAYTVSYETTRILGPVDEDGRIDYCEAIRQIEREGVTTDNNAVVLLRKAYGRAGIAEDQLESYFQALGMNVPPEDADFLKSLDEYWDELNESIRPEPDALWEQQEIAVERPWSADEFPLIAEWISRQDAHLTLIQQASRCQKYYSPLITEHNQPILGLFDDEVRARLIGRLLSARAMLNLQQGRTDAAHEDAMTLHRLAELMGSRVLMIPVICAGDLEYVACGIDRRIAEYGELTNAQYEHFREDFGTLGQIGDVVRVIDVGERFSLLNSIVAVADGETLSDDVGTSSSEFRNGFHCDPTLTLANELLDNDVAAARIGDRTERTDAFARNADRFDQISDDAVRIRLGMLLRMRSAISEKIGNTLILMLFPATCSLSDVAEQVSTHRQLRDVAVALSRRKAKSGTYPESLDDLVPEYLADSPVDRFSGQPLKYDRRDDGFRIWSVGTNEEDDGGDESWDVVVQTAGYPPDSFVESETNEPAEQQ